MELYESKIYSLIGEDGFTRLVAGFYRRIAADDILRPMYPADEFPQAEARLRGFLIQRFGGPDTYSRERGHPRLRMRHGPFHIDKRARDRWVQLMDAALNEAALPPEVETVLRPFLHNTATFLINQLG